MMMFISGIMERLTGNTERYIQDCYRRMSEAKLIEDEEEFNEFNNKLTGFLDALVCQELITKDDAKIIREYYCGDL